MLVVGWVMWKRQEEAEKASRREPLPHQPKDPRQVPTPEEGSLASTRHWVPGSNTNQGKDRHVRKHQGLQGTGWTLQTRGKVFTPPCTINDQGTGSPRSLSSNAGAEKGSEGAEQMTPLPAP